MPIGRLAPLSNLLLASLPAEQYRRLLPDLESFAVVAGDILTTPNYPPSHVYFPCSCVVSLEHPMEDGASVGVALVGREGMAGVSVFMDGAVPSARGVVQTAGQGFRLTADAVCRELGHGGQLQSLALRYIQALITQMAQTAVCNRHHNLDQQICRWLLLSLDRMAGNELILTQELIAQMAGVRREGVTTAAGKLQDAGIISYSRGRISVLDRQALEARVCECYLVVRLEYERLLPAAMPRPSLQVIHAA